MHSTEKRISFWRKRWLRWVVGSAVVCLVLLAVVVDILAHRAEPFVRAEIVQALSNKFHARVELDSFHLSLGNSLRGEWGIWADGRGLRIWPPAQVEGVQVPQPDANDQPLIQLGEFRFHAPLRYRSGMPVHISQVVLKGLEIHIPPKSQLHRPGMSDSVASTPPSSSWGLKFQVDKLECTNAEVELETDKPGKLPLQFPISRFEVTGISAGAPMHFEAELSNPKPPGIIHSTGTFGPWSVADPGESQVSGDYTFDHADLSVFKGIAGILNSTGHYSGSLRNITVDGETDTPDFKLSQFGNQMALHTEFHARVDATNGDTWLEPVNATLGQSHITAQGQVVRVLAAGDDGKLHSIGHDIALTVKVNHGHLEDFLHLASKTSTPILTGDATVNALLHIPPGSATVHERMTLKGRFILDNAAFTSATVQNRIKELSLRGQGRPGDLKTADAATIKSQMEGNFDMGSGMLKLPEVSYIVPGADIEMKGTYYMQNGNLDFTGIAKLQATISQMVGGWKGLLLSPADRFFKKDGAGTEIPIFISGTREKPEFGYDSERTKSTKPQRPGDPQ
jgi:hypothetical protein